MGLSTNVIRVIVFCLSAFIAGIARHPARLARLLRGGRVTRFFQPFSSLLLLALLALAPFAEPWYALIA